MPLSRRLAAAAALLAVPAMAAVVVIALFGEPSGLVLALVLLASAAGAAWVVATRRGVLRWLALALAVACLAGIAAALVAGSGGILTLVLIAALLAAFGGTAREALGPPPLPGRRVGAARRGVLIYNTRSGGGKAGRFHLADEARKRGIEPVELTPGSDLRALAERAVADGADVLGMAGGDGSQALVASVAAAHGLPHVCIPAGTRNHFALDLGLDRDDVVGALDAYGAAVEHTIDLAEVNGRVFVNNASLGAYAEVVQSEAYRDAKLRTWARMAPDVLVRGPERPLRYTDPGGVTHAHAVVVLVSNNPYHLATVGGAGTRARLDRGTLGVATIHVRNAADAAALTACETTGSLRRYRGFRQWETEAFDVETDGGVPVGVDGEALVLDPPLQFRVRPRALAVRIPPGAPGRSPGARAVSLTLDNLRRLGRVALGKQEEPPPARGAPVADEADRPPRVSA